MSVPILGVNTMSPLDIVTINPHPCLIFSQSDYLILKLIQIYTLNGKQCRSRSVGSSDLHCLKRLGISSLSRTRVKC